MAELTVGMNETFPGFYMVILKRRLTPEKNIPCLFVESARSTHFVRKMEFLPLSSREKLSSHFSPLFFRIPYKGADPLGNAPVTPTL